MEARRGHNFLSQYEKATTQQQQKVKLQGP
jgi:hypothetical protein